MIKGKNPNNDDLNENNDDIEVIIGDDSVFEISEVGDIANNLRPKDSVKSRKKFIIPIAKKNKKNEDEDKK